MANKGLTYYGQKVNGKYSIPEAEARQQVNWIAEQKDGCIENKIQRAKKPKSDKQRGNIFGNMIQKVVDYCNDNDHIVDTSEFLDILFDKSIPSGIEVTKDFVKACLYRANPTLDEDGNEITLSDMSTEQAAIFTDRSADLLSSRICHIPNPNPDWKQTERVSSQG